MMVQLAKNAIDLGIVTSNADAMVGFYRDLLGFREEPSTPFPMGGKMYRLWCGESLIKIVAPDPAPNDGPVPGPIASATGYRYWTMIVENLEEVMSKCEAAGVNISVPLREVRAGVTIGIVEDPDGNLVEFVKLDN
ncbi:MAG: VOC family protein [Pseudomonadales bacterium]|nr:VOC family protein [Pseudomonadales bacterium]